MSIGELFAVKKALLREQFGTIRRYYPKSFRFALLDLSLGAASLFFNPYRVCRKFLQRRGASQIHAFGETPFSTLHRIATFCQLRASDCWLELGSGRGKSCFWVAHFVGCPVIGIEWIPLFSRLSRLLALLFRLSSARFQCLDFSEADFSSATCVYLYGTFLSEEELLLLAQKMEALPPGARIVTISSPLPPTSALAYTGSFPVSFPWGDTEAFTHRRIG